MPRFYLRAAAGNRPRRHVSAVCFKPIDRGDAGANFSILLSDEWGEKEVLRKMKDMGLFELGQAFIPVGPHLEEDLSLMVSRAVSHGILRLDEESVSVLIDRKLAECRAFEGNVHEEAATDIPARETNSQLVKRLCAEGEEFLRCKGIPR